MNMSTQEEEAEDKTHHEWLYVKIDEYGKLIESTYIPMLGSRFEPPIPIEPSIASKQIHFQINREGIIFNGVPQILNGRRLILQGHVSPALGRTTTVAPTCTWRHNTEGGWTCS
jgi:hypothetical protein